VRMIRRCPFAYRTCLAVVAIMAGCQTSPPAQTARPAVTVNGAAASPDGSPASNTPQVPIEQALKSDPCAARLHDVSGAMLMYYALHNRLPARLEDLAPFAEPDRPLNFKCPTSGQAYAYVPGGLRSQGDERQIVLHDAAEHAGATRWTIMMQRPRGRQPAAMWVVPLPAATFQTYSAPPPTPGPEPSK
jgi:hypothetical protein